MHTFESKIKPDKISGSSYVVLMPSLGETILGQQDILCSTAVSQMQYFRNVRFISGCQAIYEAISNTCFIGEDKTEKKYGRQLQSASAIVVKLVIVWFF